jgi:replicative superfamily II helicase
MVDQIPTFADCPRRIYMSATIGDDSALIRTFDAKPESVAKPICSKSLAGVSERMILAPELMNLETDVPVTVHNIATWMVIKKEAGTVILVPSKTAAADWKDVAEYPETTDEVAEAIRKLQAGESLGPFVFANRYDGIDLPGDTCRLLIVSGLPRGASEYDQYRANVFAGGAAINSELAQRIEQGIGRGARGANDYCVVIITGKDLIGWISKTANLRFLTSSTRAQLEMGAEISRTVTNRKDLAETIERCLDRDSEWTHYHAETLAETVQGSISEPRALKQAGLERRAFNLVRDAHYEKAITKLRHFCDGEADLDRRTKGWLLQMAASAANHWGQGELAIQLQQNSFALNRSLPRPKKIAPYEPLALPGPQAEAMVGRVLLFNNRRGCLAEFDEMASHLVREASSNQFEQALADLAGVLGFVGERPEQCDPKGPDVLWLLDDKLGLVIEAKSRKKTGNALTREQHGQLLHGAEWFQAKYPRLKCLRASVHPNSTVSRSTVPGVTKALTFENLERLLADTRVVLQELCQAQVDGKQLVTRCEKLLAKSRLTPDTLPGEYLISFSDK